MRLLYVTQKLHGQDAFTLLWVNAFRARGYDVEVVCLEDRVSPQAFPVHSMGKEKGAGKLSQVLTFWKLISSLKYDRVFVHMSPIWGLLGAPVWILRRVPTYLWYTHYKTSIGLLALMCYAKRFFCATPQSLPQLKHSTRKIVTGHGIDLHVWPKRQNMNTDPRKLLTVHRLSRSKRLELVLQAMTLLPLYTLDIYGVEAEADYAAEMKALAASLDLMGRVTFHGSAPFGDLPGIYIQYRLDLNMASETIDKSMLEAMTCGCYPVTTWANAQAIGIPAAPEKDTPEAIARFVQEFEGMDADELYRIVEVRHSLAGLIAKMDAYMASGT